ncbi:MAG: family 78 glycoside hydrolase catalytic domain [Planctomycetaceae bacterium]|nr:family 78 glycoside hydrolase catalytic domain [Planctomycetaceae bacterium]
MKRINVKTIALLLIAGVLSAWGVSDVFAQQEKAKSSITPYDLRVEYMTTPQGIDEPSPRFSWKLKSDVPGDEQTAYRIFVCSMGPITMGPITMGPVTMGPVTIDNGSVHTTATATATATATGVWDTGVVKSGNSVNIEYAGEPLKPGTDYEWQLVVTDKSGVESQPVVSAFSTGLFATEQNPNPWGDAEWIGFDDKAETPVVPDLSQSRWIWSEKPDDRGDCRVGVATFRKTFELPKDEITSAICAFTGDNECKVFVNGQQVSEGTNFKNAPVADIAKHLKPGKNLIAVEVANVGNAPNPAGMLGAVKVQFKNSPELNLVSDDSWKTAPSAPQRWNFTSFDDSSWTNAVAFKKFGDGPWGEVKTGQPRVDLPARYLKYSFKPESKPIVRATAYISGLGYYELYVNGKRIGDHVLDPVLKDYNVSVPYVTYKIDPATLKSSEDISISVTLGNGRFYAPRTDEPIFTKDYGTPRLLFKMVIEYAGGMTQETVSGNHWKIMTDGPIRGNNDYDGEIYDARMEKNLKDAQTWRNVQKVDAPKGKLVAQNMPAMRVTEEIKPKSLKEVSPGVWVFDMGQNMVGWCRLKVRGKEGTEIKMRHAETLLDDGNLYVANIRGAKARDIYTCKGDGTVETYQPRFTYHGFRYVELTGFPGKPNLDTITGCVVHTGLPFTGKFECSNEMINKIHQNIFWGTRGNYLSIPTDCPQRDERQGWQGDRAAESLGEMFLFDNVTLYSKWLQDIEESQTPEGNLSDVCPPFWPLYSPNVTWPSAFTIVPESILKQYGDDRPIKRHYAAMVKWMNFLDRFVRDCIIEADNYGDWCVPPERKDLIHSEDPARQTSRGILATSYYIHNLNLLARYAKMLGKDEESKAHLDKAAMMTAAFNKKFYNAETGKYDNGTQTSCVLPLYFGIVPEDQRDKVFATLMNNIEHVTGFHIGTGLIGGQWINRVLTSFGRADIAYRFASNTDYPSWGYMVEHGATTVWELWNGNTADPAMNSGNHVMLVGDLTIWLYQNLAGIKSDDGFRTLDMAPLPVGDLTFVNAEYESVRGTVKSHWQKKDGRFTWDVTIPVGTTAKLTVPTDSNDSIMLGGVKANPDAEGRLELGSGTYTITAVLK